jgi:hypothetical protein
MATGQSSFSFTGYGEVSTFDGKNGGWQLVGNGYANPSYQSLPVAGTRVVGISPGVVFGTAFGQVTANSIVEIIPPALQPIGFSKKYLCDSTEAQLAALRT